LVVVSGNSGGILACGQDGLAGLSLDLDVALVEEEGAELVTHDREVLGGDSGDVELVHLRWEGGQVEN